MVDAEFSQFIHKIETASDFQSVMKAHRDFIASIVRLSMVDNLVVQENFERIFQLCLRFVAVVRILHEQQFPEQSATSDVNAKTRPRPVIVPQEELDAIQKDFTTNVSQIFQVSYRMQRIMQDITANA